MLRNDLGQPNPESSAQGKSLKFTLMSIRSRYGSPRRSEVCSGRMGLSQASIDHHVQTVLREKLPGLWYANNASEAFQVTLAKDLYGKGFDAPLEGRETRIPQYPDDGARAEWAGLIQTIEWLAEDQKAADRRLQEYNQSNPETLGLSEQDIAEFKVLAEFSTWAKSQPDPEK